MGEDIHKHPKNVSGKYYVIYECCLVHEVCTHCAPSNFTVDWDDEWAGAHVHKQPATPKEEEQCKQALEDCPARAIRDDGETNTGIAHWDDSMSSKL